MFLGGNKQSHVFLMIDVLNALLILAIFKTLQEKTPGHRRPSASIFDGKNAREVEGADDRHSKPY